MKIISIRSKAVSVPVRFSVVSCVRQTDHVMFVLVDVETDEGITGIAYVQAFNAYGAKAIIHCLDYLESVISGRDALETGELWKQMRSTLKLLGLGGIPMFALSAVDIALWDIKGKASGVPVYQLLGYQQSKFDAYQSDGLWLVSPLEAARQAEQFVHEGFHAVKMRFGRTDAKDDIAAAQEVRRAIGDDIELMGDVNQGWTCDQAMLMAEQLADVNLTWLEEPVDAEDADSHNRLQKSTRIPIATGENLYGILPWERFTSQGAASVYTPDLQRCGGVSGWLEVNQLLAQNDIGAGLHLFPEYAAHLFPLINKPVKLEWMSWPGILFQEPLTCENGQVKAMHKPGFGMQWDAAVVNKYTVC